MSAHEFTINVTDLDAGGKEYDFPIRSAWLRGALEDNEATASTEDGQLSVRASKSGHDVVVHGTLDVNVRVPCARCLEPFDLPIHSDISVLYVPAARIKVPGPPKSEKSDKDSEPKGKAKGKGKEPEEEYEFTSEEADTLGYDGDTVVLDDLVRDEVILEIPMIPLCSDGCPGMSPAPEERNASAEEPEGQRTDSIDPRLAPLLRFKKETKS